MDKEYLLIGRLVKPFGLKGDIKADFYVDDFEELKTYSAFYIKDLKIKGAYQKIKIENIRVRNGEIILGVEGCSDRNQSELYKGIDLFVDEEEIPELKKDVFYIKDLMDCEVFYQQEIFGKVYNLLEIANKTMLVLHLTKGGDMVIPFENQYVESVDVEQKKIVVHSIDPLL